MVERGRVICGVCLSAKNGNKRVVLTTYVLIVPKDSFENVFLFSFCSAQYILVLRRYEHGTSANDVACSVDAYLRISASEAILRSSYSPASLYVPGENKETRNVF